MVAWILFLCVASTGGSSSASVMQQMWQRCFQHAVREQRVEDINAVHNIKQSIKRRLIVMPLSKEFNPNQFNPMHNRIEFGDKCSLPDSIGKLLMQNKLDMPWIFEVKVVSRNASRVLNNSSRLETVYSSPLDFRAPENYIFIPQWMMQSLHVSLDMQRLVTFYFDPISPYAWLAWRPLKKLVQEHANTVLKPVPVLFAGLLNSNGQLGPAEIPRKRDWLIKDIFRRAKSQGLTVCPPPTHPFNPLLPLRLASCDMSLEKQQMLTGALLDAAWMQGKDISDETVLMSLLRNCDIASPHDLLKQAHSVDIKDRLRDQTNTAIANGAFGVPTTLIDGELFWGSESDTMDQISDVLCHPKAYADTANLLEAWRSTRPSATRKK